MVTSNKKNPAKANNSTNFFRPKPLQPPLVGQSSDAYAQYVVSYKLYLSTLADLKKSFWESHPKTAPAAKGKAPAKVVDPAQKLARNRERRQRRKEKKHLAAIKEETKILKVKTSLAVAKKQYAEVARAPAPQKKKGVKAAKPQDKGKKPEKAEPKPGEDPSGSGRSKDDPSGDSKGQPPSPRPNRKERRRARFGPPRKESAAKPAEPEAPEKDASDEEAEADSDEESSEEEIVPFVNPFAAPVPSGSGSGLSVLERASANFGKLSDTPIRGVDYQPLSVAGRGLPFPQFPLKTAIQKAVDQGIRGGYLGGEDVP